MWHCVWKVWLAEVVNLKVFGCLRLTLEVADVLEGVCRSTETGTRRSTDSKE